MHFPKRQLSVLYGAKLLVDVNINSILYCRERLSLEHIPLVRSSALNARTTKSQLVADLCHEVGATHYICGPGALAYLDMSWGVNNSYFFAEYMITRIDGFGGDGLDLSDDQWMFGLAFEF